MTPKKINETREHQCEKLAKALKEIFCSFEEAGVEIKDFNTEKPFIDIHVIDGKIFIEFWEIS